jgi:hypothetical protein
MRIERLPKTRRLRDVHIIFLNKCYLSVTLHVACPPMPPHLDGPSLMADDVTPAERSFVPGPTLAWSSIILHQEATQNPALQQDGGRREASRMAGITQAGPMSGEAQWAAEPQSSQAITQKELEVSAHASCWCAGEFKGKPVRLYFHRPAHASTEVAPPLCFGI